MEVLKMENKCLTGGCYASAVDTDKIDEFLDRCFIKNGTTYGAYTKELPEIVEKQLDVLEGKLEVEEIMDQRASLLFAHIQKESETHFSSDETHFFRKNRRSDSTRVYVNKFPIRTLNRLKHFVIDNYHTIRGNLSLVIEQSIELFIKREDKFIKLVKPKKKPVKSFISDEEGQFNSIDINDKNELLEWMDNRIKQLEQHIEIKIESTVQSVFNISSKVGRKVKKIRNGNRKSVKADAKLDKAERILNNLKKTNEHRFTIKEYSRSLAKLIGQGDPRTPRSDLKMLEADDLINKVRNNANGEETYEFTENTEYYKYNSDLAKTRFFADVKEKFVNDLAFTLDDLNEFIFEKYELFDASSQNKRLKWLLSEGLVRRHDVNPRILQVQK
jgi:hypothetical protein